MHSDLNTPPHTHSQRFYSEALERRAQHWQLIQSLQSERFLDGIGQEGRDALSASLWSISSNLIDHNKRQTGSIDNLSMKCSPTIQPLRKKPLCHTKSEDQSQKFLPQKNSMGLVRINSAACPRDRLRAAGSLDLLLQHPSALSKLRGCQSQSQLITSVPSKSGSDSALSMSFNHIPSSPLSQDSGTESGDTISADTLELSDEELVNLSSEGKKEKQPQKSLSADDAVTRESEKLKSILRNRDEVQFDTLKSILHRHSEQLDIPCKPLNRVQSDDSGIAFKQTPSSEYQNSCSPSPCGRISVPDSLSPRPKMKVHFRSQSDTSTITLDIMTPTSEEMGDIGSSNQNDETPLTEQSFAPNVGNFSTDKVSDINKVDFDKVQSQSSSKDHSQTSPNSKTKLSEVKLNVTSPNQSRLPPPPVSKKPLCRLKTIVKTPPESPVKTNVSVPSKKAGEPSGKIKTPPTCKNSTAAEAKSVSGPSKRKSSQLRRPSVVTVKKDFKNVSVKETKLKFESPTSAVKPPKKDERRQTLSPSKSTTSVKKTSSHSIQSHQRSKFSISPNDNSNFQRQGAVRTKASSPKIKKSSIPKQNNLARSSTVSEPKRKTSIAKLGKPASLDETGESLSSQDVLYKLAATTSQVSKLPRIVSKPEPKDPKLRIEVVGGSERGIDIPLNFNSNNSNKSIKLEINNEHERKPSTYHILEAVTIDYTVNRTCSTLPHKRKRSPIEWSQFGTSWKSPHTLHTYPAPRTVPFN